MFVCSVASRLLQVGQNFIPSSVPSTFAPSPTPAPQAVSSGLNDLFELSTGMAITTGGYVAPKAVSSRSGTPPARSARVGNFSRVLCLQVWLPAVKAKGLEISGTFSRRQGHMYMDMTFTNKALQHMTDFAVQFNKNRWVARRFSDSPDHLSAQLQAFSRPLLVCVCVLSPPCSFGMIPTSPLPIHTPLMPSQSIDASLPINTIGPVMKMDPLNNLQVTEASRTRQADLICRAPKIQYGGPLISMEPLAS